MQATRRTIDLSLYLESIGKLPGVSLADAHLAKEVFELAFDGNVPGQLVFDRGAWGDGRVSIGNDSQNADGGFYHVLFQLDESGWLESSSARFRMRLPSALSKYFFGAIFGKDEYSARFNTASGNNMVEAAMQIYSCAEKKGSADGCEGAKSAQVVDSREMAELREKERSEIDEIRRGLIKAAERESEKIWQEVDHYFEASEGDLVYFPEYQVEKIMKIIESNRQYRFYAGLPDELADARKRRDMATGMMRAIAKVDLGLDLFAKRGHCNGEEKTRIRPCKINGDSSCTGYETIRYLSCDYGIDMDIGAAASCECSEKKEKVHL